MRLFPVSRLTLLSAAALMLAACSSTPDSLQSHQQAPGSAQRPVLSDQEARALTSAHYFTSSINLWQPHPVRLEKPDFIVGPPDAQEAQFHNIQDAVNAAVQKHSIQRQYIAIMPGRYSGTVYIPKAPGSLTLYGTGDSPADTTLTLALTGNVEPIVWELAVNASGQYQPGDPAWYMYQSCITRDPPGGLCSAVVWSQNDGLQLRNLTIENTFNGEITARGEAIGMEKRIDFPATALRSDGDRVQLEQVNLLGRINTFLVTNSDIHNRLLDDDNQPRVLVRDSYLEGMTDIVSGRGAIVFENDTFQITSKPAAPGTELATDTPGNSQDHAASPSLTPATVFAPATLASLPYGFLVENSRFFSAAGTQAKLGRNWDISPQVNGQLLIRNSTIDSGFDALAPWGEAVITDAPFAGNTGEMQDKTLIRNINDPQFNRLWEYHNYILDNSTTKKP